MTLVLVALGCCSAAGSDACDDMVPSSAQRRDADGSQPRIASPSGDLADFADSTYDRLCDAQMVLRPSCPPTAAGQAAEFNRLVPRRLHQIWFGAEHEVFAERMTKWRAYADKYGYEHKIWREDDDALIEKIMPEKNYQIYKFYLQTQQWCAASDVLRLSLLSVFGGIYLDSDLQPPRDRVGPFDLDQWLPLRNITLIAETFARETASQATFLTNCLLMAPAQHPLVEHWIRMIPINHAHWMQTYRAKPEYTTGPFFITRQLCGPINVLGMEEGYRYQLFGDNDMLDAQMELSK